jgi:hypothetical protein
MPMSVILPIIAVLSVTAEWSQRSGLATFTLVPRPRATTVTSDQPRLTQHLQMVGDRRRGE